MQGRNTGIVNVGPGDRPNRPARPTRKEKVQKICHCNSTEFILLAPTVSPSQDIGAEHFLHNIPWCGLRSRLGVVHQHPSCTISHSSRLAAACLHAAAAWMHSVLAWSCSSAAWGRVAAAVLSPATVQVHTAAASLYLLPQPLPRLVLPLLLLALTTGSTSWFSGTLDTASTRDRGLRCGIRRRELLLSRLDHAACALAAEDFAYSSTALSRRREVLSTRMEAALPLPTTPSPPFLPPPISPPLPLPFPPGPPPSPSLPLSPSPSPPSLPIPHLPPHPLPILHPLPLPLSPSPPIGSERGT